LDDDEYSIVEDGPHLEQTAQHDQQQASNGLEMEREDSIDGTHSSLNVSSQTQVSTTGSKQKSTEETTTRKRTRQTSSSRQLRKSVPSTRDERAKRRNKASSDDDA